MNIKHSEELTGDFKNGERSPRKLPQLTNLMKADKTMDIYYQGITTNNIKDVDIQIRAGDIIFFGGPSGSGKSSIAVDTIYKISEDELFQLFNTRDTVSRYEIKAYENILPAICLQQENYNRNPRSTIATYFGLDTYFKQLFSLKNGVSQSFFQFNTLGSACETCKGTGSTIAPDLLAIVDYSEEIKNIPFKTWRTTHKDYYQKSLEKFCAEHSININSRFNNLSKTEQDILLHGESRDKYKIEFRSNGRKHTRTAKYVGPIREIILDIARKKLSAHRKKYLGEITCDACNGMRFSSGSLSYKLYGKSIGEIYLMEIDQLHEWLNFYKQEWQKLPNEARSLQYIERFLKALTKLNLNYLNLNRSIPSLSGGELQRLRLAKAINSQFTNFIYVLDEPTSGLHPSEWDRVSEVIVELKNRKNTILLIEHNEFLRGVADKVIWLGPEGGSKGGRIIANRKEHDEALILTPSFYESKSSVTIREASNNNIHNLSCELPLGTITGICGVSGSGKTSFMRSILPRYLNDTQYFRQTPIRGNAYSIVATALGIYNEIVKLFSVETRSPRESFLYASKGKGQCETCVGKGIMEEDSSYIPEPLLCPACGGYRFSKATLRKRLAMLNIYEFLSLSIDDIRALIPPKYALLANSLALAANVGLGYLTLFQSTATLSGGEAQRVKFTAGILASKKKQVFLLDEPFRGVDKKNIQNIFRVLCSLVESGSSVFISEHNPFALKYCSYILELGPGAGIYGGRVTYLGETAQFRSQIGSPIAGFVS